MVHLHMTKWVCMCAYIYIYICVCARVQHNVAWWELGRSGGRDACSILLTPTSCFRVPVLSPKRSCGGAPDFALRGGLNAQRGSRAKSTDHV